VSILKPEGSITLGAAVAAMTYGVYSYSLPSMATVQATLPHDEAIESGRKRAAWTSAIVVSAVALMTRDKTVFTLGGLMIVALDWHARHANAVHPDTGKMTLATPKAYEPAQVATAAPENPVGPATAGFAY
jgi:hypothetical protein